MFYILFRDGKRMGQRIICIMPSSWGSPVDFYSHFLNNKSINLPHIFDT